MSDALTDSRWGASRQETAEGFTQLLFGGDRPLAGASTEPAVPGRPGDVPSAAASELRSCDPRTTAAAGARRGGAASLDGSARPAVRPTQCRPPGPRR